MNTTVLKSIMKERGISQNKLSHLANAPTPSMSLFMRGMMPCYPAWRHRISEALNVPESVLFSEFEKKE